MYIARQMFGETCGEEAVLLVVPSRADGGERRGPDLLLSTPHPARTNNIRAIGQTVVVIQLNSDPATKKKLRQKGVVSTNAERDLLIVPISVVVVVVIELVIKTERAHGFRGNI